MRRACTAVTCVLFVALLASASTAAGPAPVRLTPEARDRFAAALQSHRAADWATAAREFADLARSAAPIADYALLYHADSLARLGDAANARLVAQQIPDQWPDSRAVSAALILAAEQASRAGDEAGAAALWRRVLDRFPDLPDLPRARLAWAQALGNAGRLGEAAAASRSRRRRAPRRQPGPRPRPRRQARPLDPRLREDPAEEESRGRHRPARPARRRRAQERRGTGGVAAQGAAPGSGERAQVGGARLRQACPELSGKRRGFGRDLAARLALLAARRLWRGDRAVESYRLGPGGQPGIPRRFCVLDRPRPRGARPDRGRDPAVRSAHRGSAAQLLRDPCLPPGAARPAEPWSQSRLRPARGIAARGPSRAAPGRGAVGPRRGAAGGGTRRLRRRRDGFHGATGGR